MFAAWRWLAAVLAMVWTASGAERDVMDDLQRGAFDYFWFEAHPKTGLIKDRAGNHAGDDYHAASIAATGFGLAALPAGVERGWVSRKAAEERAALTLRTFASKMTSHHGWFYHFVDWKTGERIWKCELSSIDTGLFLAGALAAGEYFGGGVKSLAEEIYQKVDFPWMLTDGGAKPDAKTLSMGWHPEKGFIKARWDTYSEHLVLNLMALGSPTHPIAGDTWLAWKRNTGEYGGFKTFACGPLFTHQYSQAFVDFRGKKDATGWDYFETARQATLANRAFCIEQSARHKTYGTNRWGLSATDTPTGGYEAYGAPPGEARHDGTLSPWNTVASIVYAPDLALETARELGRMPRLWGRYGVSSAYNLEKDWVAPDVIGIDAGAALLMIENYRTGLIWRLFMANAAVQRGLEKAGFTSPLGIFEGHGDIGEAAESGRRTGVIFDGAQYTVSGNGANMWFTNDALHFVWKKMTGDVSLAADILVKATDGNDPHRKGVLMVRQSLDTDAAYADAALHGDGLTSLQYREAQGARTFEIQANVAAPRRLRIEKRGKYVSMSIAKEGETLRPAGGAFRLELADPFYVGIGMCAHNSNRVESAVFNNVELKSGAAAGLGVNFLSVLETVMIASRDRRVTLISTNRITAPSWEDGTNLVYEIGGRAHRIPFMGGTPQPLELNREPVQSAAWATDDEFDNWFPHPSPDGRWLVFLSCARGRGGLPEDADVLLRIMPRNGGRIETLAKLLGGKGTIDRPCWSPDSRRVAFVSYQRR